MTDTARPFRSVLYMPGSNARALEKARTIPVDAVILDLEDAVSIDQKDAARALVAEELAKGGFGNRCILVRVNGLDTEWGAKDIAAMAGLDFHGLLVPKVNNAADVDAVVAHQSAVPVWAMVETCLGVMNAQEIAAHPNLAGFVLGTNDLAKELNSRHQPDRGPLITSLQMCMLAARAHGVVCVDGVYNAFRDEDGLRRESEQGRDFGFDGKSLIHPGQVAIANEIFAPSAEAIDLAKRQIEAFEEAQEKGLGVAVVDGQIVENLHIETARATLAKANMISAMEG